MAVEDSRRHIPANVASLPINQQIAFHIFNLRNVSIYQGGWPMRCSVLLTTKPNSATELACIGKPAVPALIALLRDRRPTRSVALWRPWHVPARFCDIKTPLWTSWRLSCMNGFIIRCQCLNTFQQIPRKFRNRL